MDKHRKKRNRTLGCRERRGKLEYNGRMHYQSRWDQLVTTEVRRGEITLWKRCQGFPNEDKTAVEREFGGQDWNQCHEWPWWFTSGLFSQMMLKEARLASRLFGSQGIQKMTTGISSCNGQISAFAQVTRHGKTIPRYHRRPVLNSYFSVLDKLSFSALLAARHHAFPRHMWKSWNPQTSCLMYMGLIQS